MWSEMHPKKGLISTEGLNCGGTTITHLNKLEKKVAEEKLWTLLHKNIGAIKNLVTRVGEQESSLRMVRLTSDVFTGYTHRDWSCFYKQPDVVRKMEELFAPVGDIAREKGVRLSFHPGAFTVLASDKDEIVKQAIDEFEYHVDMARMMGFAKKWQDFKINIHISGRRGPSGFREAWKKLSPEARNCITIENEEISYGLDDCLSLGDIVPIVLDVHHHWVREGEYIKASDERIRRILDSWHGVRPVIHYSVSRTEHLSGHAIDQLPSRDSLMKLGVNKQKLRAHSDSYWNSAVNDWALEHWEWADIMCESKWKQLASFELYEYAKKQNIGN